MKPLVLRTATVVLLAGALAAAGYLLVRSLALAAGTAGAGDVCSALFARGCDETLRDPFSRIGGIPLAGWGCIHFATLLLLLLLGRTLDGFRPAATAAASLLALTGGVASAGLVLALLLGAFPLCPLCLVANGLNLAAVLPVVRWGGPFRDQIRTLGRGLRYVAGARPADPGAARWRVLGFAVVGLMAVALYQWVLIETDRSKQAGKDDDPAKILADYRAAPVHEIPADPDDAVLGPGTAPARLVVFSDAFCPFCRIFWMALSKVTAGYGDRVQVVFKHFPLDSACNPAVPTTLHPHACDAAKALEAARLQGAFWPFHEALNVPDLRRKQRGFRSAASDLGLDLDRFEADCHAPAPKLKRDIELGIRLGLSATPAVFLNGRRIDDPRPKALRILLDRETGRELARRD